MRARPSSVARGNAWTGSPATSDWTMSRLAAGRAFRYRVCAASPLMWITMQPSCGTIANGTMDTNGVPSSLMVPSAATRRECSSARSSPVSRDSWGIGRVRYQILERRGRREHAKNAEKTGIKNQQEHFGCPSAFSAEPLRPLRSKLTSLRPVTLRPARFATSHLGDEVAEVLDLGPVGELDVGGRVGRSLGQPHDEPDHLAV